MRIAIILYCLLSAIINVSAAENVTPGKYLCVVSDAVGLQTNASTHQRYGGAITLPSERQKFFITIEEVKPLVSEKSYQNYCFGDDAFRHACAMGLEGIVAKRRFGHSLSVAFRSWR